MKGIILSLAPEVQIVDLSHDVTPQALEEGAFLLETAWRYFPPGAIHVVVVDPGVGTPRRRIALRSEGHFFVGPDNGVLSAALSEEARGARRPGRDYAARRVEIPAGAAGVSIENESLFLKPLATTFEGRDVFAPVAAHLSGSGRLDDLGPATDQLLGLPAFRAPREGGKIDGLVVHVDRFGNLITDIRVEDLSEDPSFTIGGKELRLARTYALADGLAAVVGSAGYVEIAMPNGNAARMLGIGPGDRVTAI
jgi:S-adenosylmethionine hydrolase